MSASAAAPAHNRLKVAVVALAVDASSYERELLSVLAALDVDIVLAAPDIADLDTAAAERGADVVLVWHERLRGADREQLDRCRRRCPMIVALTSGQLLGARRSLMRCDGWLFADHQLGDLLDVMTLSLERYCLVPSEMSAGRIGEILRSQIEERLSTEEREVLACLSRGLPNRQIGTELGLRETHVKYLVRSVLGKLEFPNRTIAGVFAAAYL